jgi:hypothetical protein
MSSADSGDDTPRGVRVGKLNTAEALREELAKLYRGARKKAGPLPTPADAARLAFVLHKVGELVIVRELEDRIRQLEGRSAR